MVILIKSALLAILMLGTALSLGKSVWAQSSSNDLPIPRMVSVKAEGVNVRTGPGLNFAIKWVFNQRNMPVEIIADYENWRKVRDWEGGEGWIFYTALSSKRTVMVVAPDVIMRRLDDASSPAVARPMPGMVGHIDLCNPDWCFVDIRGYKGWIERDKLWGIYKNELFE